MVLARVIGRGFLSLLPDHDPRNSYGRSTSYCCYSNNGGLFVQGQAELFWKLYTFDRDLMRQFNCVIDPFRPLVSFVNPVFAGC